MLTIRSAQPWDYGVIANIYNEAIATGGITMDTEPQSPADVAGWIEKFCDRERLFVGEVAGLVVGWGVIKRYSDRPGYRVCCETSVYLTSTATGCGYGSRLQQHLLAEVESLEYRHIVVKVVTANQGSVRFHQRFGFEIVGVQKNIGFIDGVWYDVVILQYLLPKRDSQSGKNFAR
ncbi:MAG: N-acetyltransferase family protein [Cyanobacteria bacterium P01_H01_bin.15]